MQTCGHSEETNEAAETGNVGSAFVAFQLVEGERINEIVLRLESKTFDDLHWDLVDDLKGVLATKAANESSDDADEQEEAIARAEEWVADNVSNGGIETTVAMALWLRGIEVGAKLFGLEVATGAV